MAIVFKAGWNAEKPNYVNKYGSYDGFLMSMTEDDARSALNNAIGKFNDATVNTMLTNIQGTETATVEQGSHQAENPKGGGDGFTMHFTMRVATKAYHCYLGQNLNGAFLVTAMSFSKPGGGFTMELANN
ncbi:MAG TPA: hypothetical protein VG456_28430 [Candidatus Sulfopaludibacter sp.]|nr:hypothetical protein [Candidatus Sulfopaludibacter sp.]